MITLSLRLNIVVLAPICFGLITAASWVGEGYGPPVLDVAGWYGARELLAR